MAEALPRTSSQTAFDQLLSQGWTRIGGFIEATLIADLRAEAQSEWTRGAFHEAAVGQGAVHGVRHEVRSDSTLWFAIPPTRTQQRLLDRLDTLRLSLNEQTYAGLVDIECHYARYGVGAHYARHADRFMTDDRRVVSAVLYLNEYWSATDGGELAIYPPTAAPVLIRPEAGTLVLFVGDLLHEVRIAHRERWSVAAWFRRRSLGSGVTV